MAEPKVRFKKDDGSSYPEWAEYALDDILTERNEPHLITDDAPQLSFTIEQGVIFPQDKKTNKRDFLMKDKENKKFLLTEYDDIIYNPANLKFGAIHRNTLGRGVVSPIYAIFYTNQNPEFIEGIVTNPAFIKRSLKYLEGTVEKLKTLKPRDFVKMHVRIPCIEEQQKIADFLSSVDEIIASSEEEVANLEKQKKAVMKKIFSQEVRFKKEDGSEFPEWEEKTFGEVCDPLQYGMNAAAGEYDGRNKYIRITDIDDSTHAYLEDNVVSPTGELNDKYLVRQGDILLARTGASTGKSYLYKENDGRMYFAGFLIRAHVKDNYDDYFIYSQTLTYAYEKWVKLTSQRSGQPGINAEEYSGYVLQIPCLEEQRLISDFLSDFDEAIAAAKKELELWKELKKGLLQQMFV